MNEQQAFDYLKGVCESQQRQIDLLAKWLKTLEQRLPQQDTSGPLATTEADNIEQQLSYNELRAEQRKRQEGLCR